MDQSDPGAETHGPRLTLLVSGRGEDALSLAEGIRRLFQLSEVVKGFSLRCAGLSDHELCSLPSSSVGRSPSGGPLSSEVPEGLGDGGLGQVNPGVVALSWR